MLSPETESAKRLAEIADAIAGHFNLDPSEVRKVLKEQLGVEMAQYQRYRSMLQGLADDLALLSLDSPTNDGTLRVRESQKPFPRA